MSVCGIGVNIVHVPRVRRLHVPNLRSAAAYAIAHGLIVNAGFASRQRIPSARIAGLHELNIGHAIVADAVLMGLGKAVAAMRRAMQGEQL